MKDFLRVYNRYNRDINDYVSLLESHYDIPLLDGMKIGRIPREGRLNSIDFKFHGVGCRIIDEGLWLDWDFPIIDGRVGIDSWKLWLYTRNRAEEFGKYAELDNIRNDLLVLEAHGLVKKSEMVSSNQYVFTT